MKKKMSLDENESGFISHLAELRKRLINSFIFLFIFFIVCYFFAEYLYGFLVEPFAKAVKDDGSEGYDSYQQDLKPRESHLLAGNGAR